MLGTLNGALEVRGVTLAPEDITADVEGINEVRDGIPVLSAIIVRYRLRVPADKREVVERGLSRHQSKCPTAVTLQGAVEVSWTADIEEV